MISPYPDTLPCAKALISSGYRSTTVQEYIQGQAVEPFVILRYDVDKKGEKGYLT